MTNLRAPFPYYGYKGQVSHEVWARLGNVGNYVEPFAGSLAVLLQRPHAPGREVVNDVNGGLVNFWRAVKADYEAVLKHSLHPLSESDLHARNAYVRDNLDELTMRLEGDPDFYDQKLAGYWLYVQCLAIGEAAHDAGPWVRENGKLINRSGSKGVRRTVPCNSNRGIQKAIPFHSCQGIFSPSKDPVKWLDTICNRLAGVRILCGDWARATKPTYTTQHGLTAVFFDPPYGDAWDSAYVHSDPMGERILSWCREANSNPLLRVAVCGYSGTWIDALEQELGWTSYAWKANGGRITTGGQSDKNRSRERIMFSPQCLSPEVGQGVFQFEGEAS